MRFFKVFLISFAVVFGIIGLGIGGMAIAGRFKEEVISPENILFEKDVYEVVGDFEMLLQTSTEDVTETKVTLSFENTTNITKENGKISDGVIIVPEVIRLGTRFPVQLVKTFDHDGLNGVEWIKGGISSLKANSENILVRPQTTKVFVDVPVFSLNLKTSSTLNGGQQNKFDIKSEFFAEASFVPAASEYMFSRDSDNGNQRKSVFFNTSVNERTIEKVADATLPIHNAKYLAKELVNNAKITAYAFESALEEIRVLTEVQNITDPQTRLEHILSKLEESNKVEKSQIINIAELVVGTFQASAQEIKTLYNQPITVFVSKENTGEQNYFNLGAEILASDGSTPLPKYLSNVGIAFAFETSDGFVPAGGEYFSIQAGKQITANVKGKDFNFFLPDQDKSDVSASMWKITAKKPNLTAKILVVLFDSVEEGANINEKSLENGNVINLVDVEEQIKQEGRIYWNNYFNSTKVLYAYESGEASSSVFSNYDFANPTIDMASAFVPETNTFKRVVFFAYLSENGQPVQDSALIAQYINVKSTATKISQGSETLFAYEIIDGNISAKSAELPNGQTIKVLFATIKTDENNVAELDGDGGYIISSVSSDSRLELQTLEFDIKQVIKELGAKVVFGDAFAFDDGKFAVIHKTDEAFKLVFDVKESQKAIFVRDYNEGKIKVRFLSNGVYTEEFSNSFSYNTQKTFTTDDDNFELDFDIRLVEGLNNLTGSLPFEIQLVYTVGDFSSNEKHYFEVTSAEGIEEPLQQGVVFEVYDGLIDTIDFEGDFSQVNAESPIIVKTQLISDGESNGFLIAASGSTNSFTHPNITSVKNELFEKDAEGSLSSKIRIVARDKYGKPVVFKENMWNLVSSNSNISVSGDGQSLSFEQATSEPVEISIVSKNSGVGQKRVDSSTKLYFSIETNGQLVGVSKRNPGDTEYDESPFKNYEKVGDKFTITDADKNYGDGGTDKTISIVAKGKSNETVNLSMEDGNNVLRLLYAVEKTDEVGYYDVFDLTSITKFYQTDGIDYSEFINFVDAEDGSISSFRIIKNFGNQATLKLKAETEIGLVFDVEIKIEQEITGNISDADYGHQGATSRDANGNNYQGVYSQHKIKIEIEANGFGSFVPLVYDFESREVIAQGVTKIDDNSISVVGTIITLTLYLKDVPAQTLRHLIFVFDSSGKVIPTQQYEKNIFDFSLNIYFNVNPNVEVDVNNQAENVEVISQEGQEEKVIVKMSSDEIGNILDIEENTESIFLANGIEDRVDSATLEVRKENEGYPYLDSFISNAQGVKEIAKNPYVELSSNKLKIIGEFNNAISFYITIEHRLSSSSSFIIKTYKIELIPDIVANKDDYAESFVVYNGKQQLQLVTNPGKDDSQEEQGDGSHAMYTFSTLEGMFKSKFNSDANLSISFDINNSSLWNVQGQTIMLVPNSIIIENQLNIIVHLEGVGSVTFPVLLMPIKAPLVKYSQVETGEEGLRDRNEIANSDLANLLDIDYLQENNIYDIVSDAEDSIDLSAINSSNENGFFVNKKDHGVVYTLRDDIHSQVSSGVIASLHTDSTTGEIRLKTNISGVDAYIIVVATFNNGLEIYYRLKIKSSAQMFSYYPFSENNGEEGQAEFLYFDSSQSINGGQGGMVNSVELDFGQAFKHYIPVGQGKNVVDKEGNTINVPTHRIALLRYTSLLDGEPRYEELPLTISDIKILSITLDGGTVVSNPADWESYVNQDGSDFRKFVFYKGNYSVVFEIQSSLLAKTTYTVTLKEFMDMEIVVDNGEHIADMQKLPSDYKFEINSPDINDDDNEFNKSYELINKKLRKISPIVDLTDGFLRYHIFGDDKEILSINDEKEILAKQTPNKVNAKIMFYTNEGIVAVYDLQVNSRIYTYEAEGDITKEKTKHEVYAGTVLNLEDVVKIAEKAENEGGNPTELDIERWVSVIFEGYENDKTPNYIIRDTQDEQKFIILPIAQDTSHSHKVFITVKLEGLEKLFKFELILEIKSSLVSENSNSSDIPVDESEKVAGEEITLDILGETNAPGVFFVDKTDDLLLGLDHNDNVKAVLHDGENIKYDINITSTNAASLLDLDNLSLSNAGKGIKLKILPVSEETLVIFRVTITYTKGSYYFSLESYYSFNVVPDTKVVTNYPVINGNKEDMERISTNTTVNLSTQNMFNENNRVQIFQRDDSLYENFDNVYVLHEIVSGENKNFNVNGGTKHSSFEAFTFNSVYNFEFTQGANYDFAEVAFQVYVSGILRAQYTVMVYKELSAVYGVKINQINEVEGDGREVFYVGEDRREIFAGVQALSFVVDSAYKTLTTVEVLKASSQGGNQPIFAFEITPLDAGYAKKILIPNGVNINGLLDLTLGNIRFKLTKNGSTSGILKLSDLMQSSENRIFAIDGNGEANLQLLRRATITYLGHEILEGKLLEQVKFKENEPYIHSNFKVNYQGLGIQESGETNTYWNGDVSIYFDSESNSLGSYKYVVKANYVVKNKNIQMHVGDEIRQVLDAFGVEKQTGQKFVDYTDGTVIDDSITQKKVGISAYFKKDDEYNGELDDPILYLYNNAGGQKYSHTSQVEPIIRSYRALGGTTYDFTLMANGAPNDGFKAFLIFVYTYYDPDGNTDDNIIFEEELEITVLPNWEVNLKNQYTAGANTKTTPETITAEQFGSQGYFDYLLIDTKDNGINSPVYIGKKGATVNVNHAIDFIIKVEVEGSASDYETNESGIRRKILKIFQPSFQERDLHVSVYDKYGYSVEFYFVVQPETLINYSGGLHNSENKIFEGNTFMLNYNTSEEKDAEHIINLTKQDFTLDEEVKVRFTLLDNSTGKPLNNKNQLPFDDDFVELNQQMSFEYLNSELFISTLNNINVKLKIELKKEITANSYETYTIMSQAFYLHQRYVTSVSNTEIRDGVAINLVNHISIEDKKLNATLGEPTLSPDKTIVLTNSDFYGDINIKAFNTNDVKYQLVNVPQSEETDYRYLSMASTFSDINIASIASYNFIVTQIEDENANIKIAIENEQLSITNTNTDKADHYLIHLFDGDKYKDIILTKGENDQYSKASVTGDFGIIGYEEFVDYDADSKKGSAYFDIREVEGEQEAEQKVVLNNKEIEYEITLKNIMAKNNDVDTIIIVPDESQGTYTLAYKRKGSDKIVGYHKDLSYELVEDGPTGESFIAKLKSDEFDFISDGQEWVIVGYKLVKNIIGEFRVIDDKKLSIVTVDADDDSSITVNFAGIHALHTVDVALNQNGLQEISLLEYFINKKVFKLDEFNSETFDLRYPNPLSLSDMSKVKGVTYYDDTIQIKVGKALGGGNIGFKLIKIDVNGVEDSNSVNFIVPVYTHDYTYSIGISNAFRDRGESVIKVGETYKLEVTSLPQAELSYLQITWPFKNENVDYIKLDSNTKISDINPEISPYVVEAFSDIEIGGGVTTINLDSEGQYYRYFNDLNKFVDVDRYYLISFKDAIHLVEPVKFKVSPYYYGIDTSIAYGGSNMKSIEDYSQTGSAGDTITFSAKIETWAQDVDLIDSYGNRILDDNGVRTLINEFKKEDSIIKFSFEGINASGGGSINPNGDLVVEIGKNSNIEEIYFTIGIYVALNGKLEQPDANGKDQTQWLYIGEFSAQFNPHKQYMLESGEKYVVSTTVESDGVNQTFVKYIEINEDQEGPTTFSVSKLFKNDTLELGSVITRKTNEGLSNVYLENPEIGNYQVSYEKNGIQINTVLKSQYTPDKKPVIAASNVVSNDIISFKLVIDGETLTGNYQNNSENTLFGEIALSEIKTSGGENFATLISGEDDYELTTSSTKAKIFWTKLDFVTGIKGSLGFEFFGDNVSEEYENDIPVLKASPMFRITQIDDEVIKSVTVNVAPASSELYAVTQAVVDGDNKFVSSQTIVYQINNEGAEQSLEKIDLYSLIEEDEENYTSIVFVEKLNSSYGMTGTILFNTDNKYLSHKVGELVVEEASGEYTQKLEIIKAQKVNQPRKVNLSDYYLVDVYTLSESSIAENKHAVILTTTLESEKDEETEVDTVQIGLNVNEDEKYNIITSGNINLYNNFKTTYSYEYVTTERLSIEFNKLPNLKEETKIIIPLETDVSDLVWNEFDGTGVEKVYYNYYTKITGKTTTKSKEKLAGSFVFEDMNDGDVISNMWNGIMFAGELGIDDRYAYVIYDEETENEQKVYFDIDTYRQGSVNNINLGEIFDFDIDYLKFSEIKLLTENVWETLGIEATQGIYKVAYDGTTYALIRYEEGKNHNIFDLVKAGQDEDEITKIFAEKLSKSDKILDHTAPLDELGLDWAVESAGYYSFAQPLKERFVVKKFEVGSFGYNLFDIFDTDLLLLADGEIIVTQLNESSQILVHEDQENRGEISVKFENDATEGISEIIEINFGPTYDSEENVYRYFVNISENSFETFHDFIMNLTGNKITYYQTDMYGERLPEDQTFVVDGELSLAGEHKTISIEEYEIST